MVRPGEQILAIYEPEAPTRERFVVQTSSRRLAVDGGGVAAAEPIVLLSESILPPSFRGRIVVEIRCDGENLALLLEDGSVITVGWSIDTATQEGYEGMWFHEATEVDDQLASFLDALRVVTG